MSDHDNDEMNAGMPEGFRIPDGFTAPEGYESVDDYITAARKAFGGCSPVEKVVVTAILGNLTKIHMALFAAQQMFDDIDPVAVAQMIADGGQDAEKLANLSPVIDATLESSASVLIALMTIRGVTSGDGDGGPVKNPAAFTAGLSADTIEGMFTEIDKFREGGEQA